MARHALLRWLLDLIRKAPEPFLTLGPAEAIGNPAMPDAIEVELLGRRFRILVEEVAVDDVVDTDELAAVAAGAR